MYVGGTHTYIAAIPLSLHGALTRDLTFDSGWKGQDSQGGWVGAGLLSYTKALPLACFRSFLVRPTPLYTYMETEAQRVESCHGSQSK